MGYYIETPLSKNKVTQLQKLYKAEIVTVPNWSEIPEGKALICVIQNGLFDAAAYCYDQMEFDEFRVDCRIKDWLLMDKELVEKLTGFNLRRKYLSKESE